MSDTGETVGVILAVRNGAAFLAETLASIDGQTRRLDEILVIDDGSTDDTRQIACAWPRVSYFRQDPAGQGSALNYGLRRARSDLLGFLDADDLWLPSKLERQLDVLRGHPELDAVFGVAEPFFDDALKSRERLELPAPEASHLLGTALVRRASLARVGPLREDLPVAACIDWYARWRHAGLREVMLPDVVLRRRIHAGNVGKSLARPEDYFSALRAHLERASASREAFMHPHSPSKSSASRLR